jgi:uncharacterized membrane protein YbhN (UPF0104 family)
VRSRHRTGHPVILLAFSLWLTPSGWSVLCRRAGSSAPSRELRGVWLQSQLGRYIPGKIWLMAGRAGYLRAGGMAVSSSVAVPFTELLYTVAATGLIASCVAVFTPGFLAGVVPGTAAAVAGGCLVLVPLMRPAAKLLYRIRLGRDGEAAASRYQLPGTWLSIRLLLFYSVLWAARGLALYLWLHAFGVPGRGIWACTAAAPLSWLAGYIVFLVPGGIGVREAAAVAIIAGPGETGPVLAAVAGQRVVLTVIELVLAAVYAGSTPLFRKDGGK